MNELALAGPANASNTGATDVGEVASGCQGDKNKEDGREIAHQR